jgi:hypothetical protein
VRKPDDLAVVLLLQPSTLAGWAFVVVQAMPLNLP